MLFGTAFGLLSAEIMLQLMFPTLRYQFPSARLTDDRFEQRAGRSYREQEIDYTFDADGFRIGTARVPKSDRAVLFIGDSFTEGMGVPADAAFPAVTCARLGERDVRARCLNAGVSGFGTSHELRLLERILHRDDLTIDAVVLQVLPNNDLSDNWEDGGFEMHGAQLAVCNPACIPAKIWWRDALLDNRFARGSRLVTVSANAVLNGLGMDPHYDATAFALERHLLREIVATAQRHGIPMVIVVAATAWEHFRSMENPFDERGRLEFVLSVVRDLHVPWVDVRAITSPADHYLPGDGHLSIAGNAVVGEATAVKLLEALGIPDDAQR